MTVFFRTAVSFYLEGAEYLGIEKKLLLPKLLKLKEEI